MFYCHEPQGRFTDERRLGIGEAFLKAQLEVVTYAEGPRQRLYMETPFQASCCTKSQLYYLSLCTVPSTPSFARIHVSRVKAASSSGFGSVLRVLRVERISLDFRE